MTEPARPNFFLIGAAKAATTNLFETLRQHPQVFGATPTEPNFFSYDEHYAQGFDSYLPRFAGAAGKLAIGEKSTSYSIVGVYPNAPARIARHCPDARILYITRNPLERLQSHWMQLASAGADVPASFSEALRVRPEFVDSCRYWSQINAYRQYFADERILVLFFEDYRADADAVVKRCLRFLGVDEGAPLSQGGSRRNQWQGKRRDTAVLRWLRRLPGAQWTRDGLPKPLRAAMRRVLKRPITERPAWDRDTRRWVVDQIAEDVARFLKFYGKPGDLWPLSEPSAST